MLRRHDPVLASDVTDESVRRSAAGDTVLPIDGRSGQLGADLRRMFEPVLDAPVPPDMEQLAADLEAALRGACAPDGDSDAAPDGAAGPETISESAEQSPNDGQAHNDGRAGYDGPAHAEGRPADRAQARDEAP